MSVKPNWLMGAVIYQIYPRSFYDAKGAGVGNLAGIIEKLDYLAGAPNSLGVTGIWLSPINTSPMADFGYDVSDYTNIDPLFGTLEDFNRLIAEAHSRDIKVLLDLVPNHTSNQHPWFIESQISQDNPKRDWYVWHNGGPNHEPPNNWQSVFGGSAWEYSEKTGQYYLHSFLSQQPDLNWENPAVRDAMKEVIRFWLRLGVDGFRVDAIDWISKDQAFRDNPLRLSDTPLDPNDYGSYEHIMSRGGPYLHDRLRELGRVIREFDNRFMIIEGHPDHKNKVEGYIAYYLVDEPDLYAPFNFEPIFVPWQSADFKQFVDTYQAAMKPGFTPIYTSGNHDEMRVGSRIGMPAARVSAMMILTLPGMAFLYYGEELGMTNVPIAPDQIQDPITLPGQGRDPQRTPMQWSAAVNAGFSTAKPWLPISDNYKSVNVQSELEDTRSLLNYYRRLLDIRKQHEVLKTGQYISMPIDQAVFSYCREDENDKLFITLNFTNNDQSVPIEKMAGRILQSTHGDRENETVTGTISLRPNEGLILSINH